MLVDTVISLARDAAKVTESEYLVCLSPQCRVVYFGGGEVFRTEEVRVPVAWKEGADPKIICYCNNVTYDEIVSAVAESKARTVKEVALLTGAMKNGNCRVNNPKGTCCHRDIESVINEMSE